MGELLDIRNLSVSFGNVRAVSDVSYTVQEGELLGVVGESGSGKSVHALSIMQLVPQSEGSIEGEVYFRGRNMLALKKSEIRRIRGRHIAMIFQDPISSLNPVFTIGFQLVEILRRHLRMGRAEAEKRSIELLTQVGISDPEHRMTVYPHQMSGGMRQRVMIAMAIACEPKLLIADEPTTALDVTIQAQIVELVKRLQNELNLTVIWISHDLGVIAGLAQFVNVMYAGKIVERGPVRKIYKNPQHPYTRGLLGSLPQFSGDETRKLVTIPGRPPDMSDPPPGCPFAPRCEHARDICADMPSWTDLGDGHVVRCWNLSDGGNS